MAKPVNAKLIRSHVAQVWRAFQKDFIFDHVDQHYRDGIWINRSLLVEAIGNAVVDIERMADLHLPEDHQKPDRHKYAAFVSRWIAKTRPIQIKHPWHQQVPEYILMINACFAYDVFSSFLFFTVPEETRKTLVYSFHLRDERGESLSLTAYSLEQVAMLRGKIRTLQIITRPDRDL